MGIGWVCSREVSGTLGRKGRVGTHKRYHCLERMSVDSQTGAYGTLPTDVHRKTQVNGAKKIAVM